MGLLFSLPKKVQYLTFISGFIYLAGALGLEIIGSFLVRTSAIKLHGISYGLISTLEEAFEMTGLIVFIYALLIFAFAYQNQKLKINLHLSSKESANY